MRDFTSGSILRHLILFTIPIMFANMFQAIFTVVDALWVGNLIGKEALAAVSTSMPVIFLLVSLIIGMGIATTILVGQSYGSKNFEFLTKVISNSFMLCIALAVILSCIGIIFSGTILDLIRVPKEIKPQSLTFMNIILGGLIFSLINGWFMGVLNGVGDSKSPLKIMSITICINIILDPLMINGYLFFPKMGIAGAAVATIISNMAGVIIYYFNFEKLHLFKTVKFHFQLDWAMIKKIFSIGWPASLQMVIVSFSALMLISMVNRFGADITAAYGIGFRIDQFGTLAIFALANAVTSISAQNIGAKKPERVKETLKYAILFSCGFSLIYVLVVNIFPTLIATAFNRDPAVVAGTVSYFRHSCYAFFGMSFMFCFLGVARGAGDTLGALMIVAINMILVRVPMCYVLSTFTPLKQNGIWLGMPISAFIGAIIYYMYYKGERWQTRQKIIDN